MLVQQERAAQERDIEPPIIHSGQELESIVEDLREYVPACHDRYEAQKLIRLADRYIKWAICDTPLSFEELRLSSYASLLTDLANSFIIKNVDSLDILCDWKVVAALL